MNTNKMIRCATGLDSVAIQTIQDSYSLDNSHRAFGLGIVNHFYDIGELTRMVNPFFLLAVSNTHTEKPEKIFGYILAYDKKRIESLRNGHSSDVIHKNLCRLEGNFIYLDHLALPPKLSVSPSSLAILEGNLVERARIHNIPALYTTVNISPEKNDDMIKIFERLKWTLLERIIKDESRREFMLYNKMLNGPS